MLVPCRPPTRIKPPPPHERRAMQVIAERPNVCKQLHMPAQSGSTAVLQRMRRGYSRDAYDDLVAHVRHVIPEVALRCVWYFVPTRLFLCVCVWCGGLGYIRGF